MNRNELTRIITNVAQRGLINLEAVQTVSDMKTAQKFSSHFRAAIEGLDDDLVMAGISAARAKGKRVFRSGVGLWLTDKEFSA